ncbi:hypothetical protein PR003_g7962 [Phytophthora rubi]|uniref:Reverse transcriptase n=1 Tax=Phytophthora rubi TaxID=129364 RepID=A0A6A3NE07_9STRA|nr:hypothetical protein PR001_g7347 [Phytophthora rubi]KAE9345409.1 hypothetical protein PR003_g7962 [Phytophthora rubi]
MEDQVRAILEKHHASFLGDGNAVPAPARGVVCDLDVGDAKPVAQRSRPIRPQPLRKVYELLEKLVQTKLIEYSDSDWASPIVIVMKKNGVDIRLCIDYRLVNQLIKLMHYPIPLIDDLLIGFESTMWFLSLDMASGFWAVPMTLRAKHISAFICPLGHFQWTRTSFGLKNAPLIDQQMLDNCLWGFVRLPASEESQVDAVILEFLGIRTDGSDEEEMSTIAEGMTVFQRNIPAPPQLNPVLGRSSYIDDIAYGAEIWGQLCVDLDRLLYRLRYWGISVSLPKSEFGKKTISYLSHEIGAEGIRAKPKIAKGVKDLPFPSTLKGVQSFLRSLNYYNKFIEDLPVIAAVLYELTDEQIRAGRDLSRAKETFEVLKRKIVSTPLLRHPDPQKPFVIIVYANPWAACAVLGHEYDGVIFLVRFTGRVLHDQELRYHPAEKEVVALIRVLRVFFTMLAGTKLIKVYTRHSVLKWIFKSKSLEGRCEQWAVRLTPWPLEIHKVQRDEDGLAAIMGAGITPRDKLDQIAESLILAKGQVVRAPPISLEMLEADYEGWLLSFDGAAKMSDRRGSAGCVLWKLPSWDVIEARGFHFEDATVNEAEYHGLIEGAKMALARGISEIVIVGDSRIAIQQAQGLIQCLNPRLQLLLNEFDELRPKFKSVKLVHVKREFNAAADYLTSKTLIARCAVTLEDSVELAQLKQLNRIAGKLVRKPAPADERKPNEVKSEITPEPVSLVQAAEPLSPDAKIFVVTRRQVRAEKSPVEEDEDADRDETPASEEVTSGFSPETATPAMAIAER